MHYITGTGTNNTGTSTVTFLDKSRVFYFVINSGELIQLLVNYIAPDNATLTLSPSDTDLTVVSVNKITVTFSGFQWWYTPKFFY